AAWSGAAVGCSEFDLHDLVLTTVDGWRPARADLALRAHGLSALPIEAEVARRETGAFLELPLVVTPRRADEVYPVVLSGLDEQWGIHEARVRDVPRGEQASLLQRGVDRSGYRVVGVRGSRRSHGCDEVGALVVAGLCQVDLVACPPGRPLLRVARVEV